MAREQPKRMRFGFGAQFLGAVLLGTVALGLACRPQVIAVCTQNVDCGYGRLCAVGRCENLTDGGLAGSTDAGAVSPADADAWTPSLRSVQTPVAAVSLEPTLAVRRTTAWCEMEETDCLLSFTLHDCLDEVMARALVIAGRPEKSQPAPRLQGKSVTFEGLVEPESASGEQRWSFALRGGGTAASEDRTLFRLVSEACDEPGSTGSRRCAIRVGRTLQRSREGDSLTMAPAHPRDRVARQSRSSLRQSGASGAELREFVLDLYSRACK
jgi:hypothetical protein